MIVEAVSKKNMSPCLTIVEHGFPINTPIMDCGVVLLMHVAATCGAAEIEQILTLSNMIAQCFVYGNSLKNACVAVVVPEEEWVMQWAQQQEGK